MKRVREDSLEQFFQDVGFVPPDNIKNPVEFLTKDDEFNQNFTRATDDHYDLQPPVIDLIRAQNCLLDPVASFLYSLAHSIDLYKEPQATNLNYEYTKKDLSTTHSFSDERLETLEQPVPEFPKHISYKTTSEPSVFIPSKENNNE